MDPECASNVCRGRGAGKRGVALIIVLGALALLVLMAVTFSIFMRTERVAAGSFQNDVIARHLLYAALARALDRVDSETPGNGYPTWDCLVSPGSNKVSGATNAPMMYWAPRAALGTNTTPSPGWIDPVDRSGTFDGRVGYIVLNASGLIDANEAGGKDRTNGSSPQEIQVGVLPEVKSAAALVGQSYETPQELTILGTNNGALKRAPEHLVTYSAFRPGQWVNGSIVKPVNLLATRATLKPQFKACLNVSDDDADFICDALQDYQDSDSKPQHLNGPCTESVPLINEVKVTTQLNFDGDNCYPYVLVEIEWAYPFVKASKRSFDIEHSVKIENVPGNDPAFVPPPIPADSIASDYSGDVNAYHTVQLLADGTGTPVLYASHTNSTVSLKVTIKLRVKSGGQTVNEVPSPWDDATAIVLTTPPIRVPNYPFAGDSLASSSGMECVDPRFNWNASPDEGQWIPYDALAGDPAWNPVWTNGSIDLVNWITKWYWDNMNCDRHPYCFVADSPISTVGELTYLLRGKGLENRWETIHLYDESADRPMDPVLRYFTVGDADATQKGLVNPNTRQSEVVHALLDQMPIDEYPGMPSPDKLGATPQMTAALSAITNWWMSPNGISGNVTNLADLQHKVAFLGLPAVSNLDLRPFEREAFYRNVPGLLGVRQQYFVVLLYAQVTKVVPQVDDKSVVSGVRGIAEVWRDPYTGHRVIRSCRAINEL